LGEEEAKERLVRLGQSRASSLPREIVGAVLWFDEESGAEAPFNGFDFSAALFAIIIVLPEKPSLPPESRPPCEATMAS
jgi:hypothetical protein